MSRKHVFISYAREDKDFAREINRRLRGSHLTAWQDVQDLRGGDSWQERIDQALRSATALVVIMSPHAARSQFVTYEWAFALGAGVRVIPVVRRPTKLHPRLLALQFIDFTKRRPWVSLRQALPFVFRPRRKVTPVIRAGFVLQGEDPLRAGPAYLIDVSIARAPKSAVSVAYEIYDETAKLLRLSSSRASIGFPVTFRTDGDVLIRAAIRTTASTITVDMPLSHALQRTHSRSVRKSIRSALRYIREN